VRRVLKVEQLAKATRGALSSGGHLVEERLGVMMIVGARAPAKLLTACGVGRCDAGEDCYGRGNARVFECEVVYVSRELGHLEEAASVV
jgi:hypothetical protein